MTGVIIDPDGELSPAARAVLADLVKSTGEVTEWRHSVTDFENTLDELADKGIVEVHDGFFGIVDVETPISEAEAKAMTDAAALDDLARVCAALLRATEPTGPFDPQAVMSDPSLTYNWQIMASLGVTDPVLGRHLISWLQVAEHAIRGDVSAEVIAASAKAIGTLVAARLAVKTR